MVRCAQCELIRLAILLGWLIAASSSLLAADRTPDLQQRFSQLRARMQALQPAAGPHSRWDAVVPGLTGLGARPLAAPGDCSLADQLRGNCVPAPTTVAQLSPPSGAPAAPTTVTCLAAQGGQCCRSLGVNSRGDIQLLCRTESGACAENSICCSAAQRASGDCRPPPPRPSPPSPGPAAGTAPGAPAAPAAGTCLAAAGGQCCRQVAGGAVCGPAPASGACPTDTFCCSEAQRASGACAPPELPSLTPPPAASTCQMQIGGLCCAEFSGATICTPPPASGACPGNSICCSSAQRAIGACRPQPPSPAAETCPPLFHSVGGTCCSQSDVAYICNEKSSGACLPTDASYNDGVVQACCRENAGGVCVAPPEPPPPEPYTVIGGSLCYLWLLVPIAGIPIAMVCLDPSGFPGECVGDDECPLGSHCQREEGRGVCVPTGAPAEAFSTCPPPSILVEGSCCAPEAVAAGTCGAFRLSECSGDKVKRGEFCVCPQGTSENKQTGACDKPPPIAEGSTRPRTPLGASAPSAGGACLRAAGGQCCAPFEGGTLCAPVPASGACPRSSVCCSEAQRVAGTCLAPPPITLREPPTPPPTVTATGGQPVCPFNQVGGSCCSATGVPVACTTRSAGAACGSSEVALDYRGVSACCKSDAGGSCTEEISAIPPPGSRPRPKPRNPPNLICAIPYLNLICPEGERLTSADLCTNDSNCPAGMRCREDGRCVDPGAPAEVQSACQPPSVMVEGSCCAPEAAAAGTCGAFRLSECTGGKVKRGEFCVCPQGTSENKQTGACDKPRPAITKKKACKPGFHRSGGRCVRNVRSQSGSEVLRSGPAKGAKTGPKVRSRSPLMDGGLLAPSIGGGGTGQAPATGRGGPLAPATGGGSGGTPRSGGFHPR